MTGAWAKRRLEDAIVPLLAIALALATGALLILAAGQNPFSVYAQLFGETLGSWYGIGQMLAKATPLAFTGLAVAIAFRAGLFNIGAEGQMTAGGLAAATAGLLFPGWPALLLVPLGIAAAAGAGAGVAAVPGWLRSTRGVHEVIGTIMMNFIVAAGAGVVMARIAVPATLHTEVLPEAARLPSLASMLDTLGAAWLAEAMRGSRGSAAVFLALAAAVAVWWFLQRTVSGYEMRAVGANPDAAATARIHVPRVTRRSFYLSGALAGMGSLGFVLGNKYYYETGFAAGAGFMGIAVALAGRNHPAGVLLAALLFGTLSHGGLVINSRVPAEIVNVLQAMIILFVIAGSSAAKARAGIRRAAAGDAA